MTKQYTCGPPGTDNTIKCFWCKGNDFTISIIRPPQGGLLPGGWTSIQHITCNKCGSKSIGYGCNG